MRNYQILAHCAFYFGAWVQQVLFVFCSLLCIAGGIFCGIRVQSLPSIYILLNCFFLFRSNVYQLFGYSFNGSKLFLAFMFLTLLLNRQIFFKLKKSLSGLIENKWLRYFFYLLMFFGGVLPIISHLLLSGEMPFRHIRFYLVAFWGIVCCFLINDDEETFRKWFKYHLKVFWLIVTLCLPATLWFYVRYGLSINRIRSHFHKWDNLYFFSVNPPIQTGEIKRFFLLDTMSTHFLNLIGAMVIAFIFAAFLNQSSNKVIKKMLGVFVGTTAFLLILNYLTINFSLLMVGIVALVIFLMRNARKMEFKNPKGFKFIIISCVLFSGMWFLQNINIDHSFENKLSDRFKVDLPEDLYEEGRLGIYTKLNRLQIYNIALGNFFKRNILLGVGEKIRASHENKVIYKAKKAIFTGHSKFFDEIITYGFLGGWGDFAIFFFPMILSFFIGTYLFEIEEALVWNFYFMTSFVVFFVGIFGSITGVMAIHLFNTVFFLRRLNKRSDSLIAQKASQAT